MFIGRLPGYILSQSGLPGGTKAVSAWQSTRRPNIVVDATYHRLLDEQFKQEHVMPPSHAHSSGIQSSTPPHTHALCRQ